MQLVNSVIIYILIKISMGAPVDPLFSSTSLTSFNLDFPFGCNAGVGNCSSGFGIYPGFTQGAPQQLPEIQPFPQGQLCTEGQRQSFPEQQPQSLPQPIPQQQPVNQPQPTPQPLPCPEQQPQQIPQSQPDPQPQPCGEQKPQPIPQAPCPHHLATDQNTQNININQNNY